MRSLRHADHRPLRLPVEMLPGDQAGGRRSAAASLVCLLLGGISVQAGAQESAAMTPPLAAAWRHGSVPTSASPAALELTRIDADTTVERNVPGTSLQAGDRAEISGTGYRWWLSKGQADIGFGLGSVGYVVRPLRGPSEAAPTLAATVTSVNVGMRYRASERSMVYVDAAGAPGLHRSDSSYFTKVGVEWKTSQSPVRLVHGGLGLQLDGSSRMTLQLKKGVLGVYMRSSF